MIKVFNFHRVRNDEVLYYTVAISLISKIEKKTDIFFICNSSFLVEIEF